MEDKTLKQHLAEALAKRWASKTPEERKEYSAMLNAKRWPNGAKKKDSTGEKM